MYVSSTRYPLYLPGGFLIVAEQGLAQLVSDCVEAKSVGNERTLLPNACGAKFLRCRVARRQSTEGQWKLAEEGRAIVHESSSMLGVCGVQQTSRTWQHHLQLQLHLPVPDYHELRCPLNTCIMF